MTSLYYKGEVEFYLNPSTARIMIAGWIIVRPLALLNEHTRAFIMLGDLNITISCIVWSFLVN